MVVSGAGWEDMISSASPALTGFRRSPTHRFSEEKILTYCSGKIAAKGQFPQPDLANSLILCHFPPNGATPWMRSLPHAYVIGEHQGMRVDGPEFP